MRCWGELKSLRAQKVGEVSAYYPYTARYVEMKVRPTTSREVGYAPEKCDVNAKS